MDANLRLALADAALVVAATAAAGSQRVSIDEFARRQLADAGATGFVHVRDLRAAKTLAHVGEPGARFTATSPVAPLSVVKVFVAASWLEHGLASVPVRCTRPPKAMLFDEMLVGGCDSAGADMAVLLRRRIGANRVLDELRRFGVRDVTLASSATDDEWGTVLTLGEDHLSVTPESLAAFLGAIGRGGGGLVSASTAGRLRSALEQVVQRGTARAIASSLAATGWHIGGKTGTGPGQCGDACDGWFASLVSDERGGRYAILVFVERKGAGGGVAARIAAAVARQLTSD